MITLNALLQLMPYAAILPDLDEYCFIQIEDNETGAHYRIKSGVLLLGGDPCGFTKSDLLKLEVACVEYVDDHCVISVKGR